MKAVRQVGGRLPLRLFALGLGIWAASGPAAVADDEGLPGNGLCGGPRTGGTLGYGPPGVFPGFQGFGLGYHPGYGYGGDALGTGAEGGYPLYGGPGYPHPWPSLRRIGGINPFLYFGGPGGPTPDQPNYFGGVGPLVSNPPVIEIGREPGEADYGSGYGCYTGAIPYTEAALAPFTTRAAAAGTGSGVSTAPSSSPAPPPTNAAPGPGYDSTTARPAPFQADPTAPISAGSGRPNPRSATTGAGPAPGGVDRIR